MLRRGRKGSGGGAVGTIGGGSGQAVVEDDEAVVASGFGGRLWRVAGGAAAATCFFIIISQLYKHTAFELGCSRYNGNNRAICMNASAVTLVIDFGLSFQLIMCGDAGNVMKVRKPQPKSVGH